MLHVSCIFHQQKIWSETHFILLHSRSSSFTRSPCLIRILCAHFWLDNLYWNLHDDGVVYYRELYLNVLLFNKNFGMENMAHRKESNWKLEKGKRKAHAHTHRMEIWWKIELCYSFYNAFMCKPRVNCGFSQTLHTLCCCLLMLLRISNHLSYIVIIMLHATAVHMTASSSLDGTQNRFFSLGEWRRHFKISDIDMALAAQTTTIADTNWKLLFAFVRFKRSVETRFIWFLTESR